MQDQKIVSFEENLFNNYAQKNTYAISIDAEPKFFLIDDLN